MSVPTAVADHPPTIDRIIDGEWLIPDLTELVHQKLNEAWDEFDGDAIRVRVYIGPERRGG